MGSLNTTENVKIIGIGKAGIKIINNLAGMQSASWFKIAAVDTDRNSTVLSKLENTFIIGEEWTHGLGCGGDVIKGERAMAHKSNSKIKAFLEGTSLLIIVGGFGGGTATGGSPVIARIAKEKNIPTIFIVTLPFAFEGHTKREIAEKQLNELIRTTSTIIPIPNDLLYSSLDPSASFEKAFEMANMEVSKAVMGVAELLRCNNLLSVDLCDFHNILCRQKSECGIGVGTSSDTDGKTRIEKAMLALLESPLLGGTQRINEADALIISITGGSDLSIGEMKYSLDRITSLAGRRTQIIVGANTDQLYLNSAQITVITILFDKISEPVFEEAPTLNSDSGLFTESQAEKTQEELVQDGFVFQPRSRGIFSNTSPTLYKGEDLDIPTFQRKDIHIDKGT